MPVSGDLISSRTDLAWWKRMNSEGLAAGLFGGPFPLLMGIRPPQRTNLLTIQTMNGTKWEQIHNKSKYIRGKGVQIMDKPIFKFNTLSNRRVKHYPCDRLVALQDKRS
jgi:hypothetical protein